ncbi:MAG: hypothetical protein ABSH12_07710 [Endomicrobiales bacterium]|jgi:hypothetical protein
MMECEDQEIKLSEITAVFKKQWFFMLLPSLLAAVIATGYVKMMPRTYESYSLVRIGVSQSKPLDRIDSVNTIMQAYPMRMAITKAMAEEDNESIVLPKDAIEYSDDAGLLKIYATAASPERATKLVSIATEMIMTRHQQLFKDAKVETDAVVDYFKSTLKPNAIIEPSISEFRLTPSIIEIAPIFNKKPVTHNNKSIPLSAFFLVFFIMMLTAFYRQSSLDVVQSEK